MPTNRNNNEVKEFAIGTIIKYNGKSYEVVKHEHCDNCSIKSFCNASDEYIPTLVVPRDKLISIFGKCSAIDRDDNISVVFIEVPNNTSKDEYYKIIPLCVDDNLSELKPVEFDLPKGYVIDKDHSDLDKGIIRFKSKWLTLEQLYKLAKESNHVTHRDSIKYFSDSKLVALANLMDIARYFNGNWEYHNNGDNCAYIIAYDKTKTTDDGYKVVHINSYTNMYFGNIMFKNKADAQYVIDNPNFREVLDNIFKV